MAHDGHFVEGGLSVKEHKVVVVKMSLNNVAIVNAQLVGSCIVQVDHSAAFSNDVLCSWPLVRSISNLDHELVSVLRGDHLWDSQGHCYRLWNS